MRNPELELAQMLQYARPASSKTENSFIKRWLVPLGAETDAKGNMILRVGSGSKVLWSSHTDTVHRSGGKQAIRMHNGVLKLSGSSKSNCLGADCTTGVWLMREMILAGVPGLYVFHAMEECGGIGSSHIASKTPELVSGIDYAIAFDRYGTNEIITEQAGGLCASDEFAASLARLLPGDYSASPNGTFTDTANYTGIVRECTNIAVGYAGHHTSFETQCVTHALRLREAMVKFDEGKLVASRTAGDDGFDSWRDKWRDFDLDGYRAKKSTTGSFNYTGTVTNATKSMGMQLLQETQKKWFRSDDARVARSMLEFCRMYPDEVADYLDQMGFNIDELYDEYPHLS